MVNLFHRMERVLESMLSFPATPEGPLASSAASASLNFFAHPSRSSLCTHAFVRVLPFPSKWEQWENSKRATHHLEPDFVICQMTSLDGSLLTSKSPKYVPTCQKPEAASLRSYSARWFDSTLGICWGCQSIPELTADLSWAVPRTRLRAKQVTGTYSSNLPKHLRRRGLVLLFPFYRKGNQGPRSKTSWPRSHSW